MNIHFDGETMRIPFERFDIDSYRLFLKAKKLPEYKIDVLDEDLLTYQITAPARFAPMLGVPMPAVERAGLPVWPKLYDDQQAIVEMAVVAKRFAVWSDCGLGKTFVQAEFARQVAARTGGRVLIVTLNEIVPQWMEMVRDFYEGTLAIVRLESREQMKEWCATGCVDGVPTDAKIAITNYEKFNHTEESDQVVNELRHLAGFVLDESSRLKSGGGKQKWAIIKSGRGIQYKLSCTATPAPNELMEFASQASFLEKLRADSVADAQEQIIWTYFTRDPVTHRWTVKRHARQAFFEWMSSWSIYVRDPRKYGWRMDMVPPPPPTQFTHTIPITAEQREFILEFNAKTPPPAGDESGTPSMFVERVNATTSSKLSQAAKGFVYQKGETRSVREVESKKPQFIADLVVKEARKGLQVLVWTIFDEESDILERLLRAHPKFKSSALRDLDVLTGSTRPQDRVEMLEDFRHGKSRVLITRADMLGYGMNFQMCKSMVFSGWGFSYEQFYQAIRRAYRPGQTDSVRVHIPIIPELEGQMFDAICRKELQHEQAIEEMERNYIAARQALVGGKEHAA